MGTHVSTGTAAAPLDGRTVDLWLVLMVRLISQETASPVDLYERRFDLRARDGRKLDSC